MKLKGRVWRLLGKFDRRQTLVEDAVERVGGAVENILAIVAEHRAASKYQAERLERAMVELGRTVTGDVLRALASEREIRAGIGRGLLEQSGRLDHVERTVAELARGARGRGGAAE